MSIRLGLARRGDMSAIVTMSRELIEHGLPWTWTECQIARYIFDPDSVVLVARDGRLPIGFAAAEFWNDHARINLLAVRPAYQRQGVGRDLLGWIKSSAQIAGALSIHLEVRASNSNARGFYRKQCFVETSLRMGYYAEQEDAVCLAYYLKAALADPVHSRLARHGVDSQLNPFLEG